jgi:WhiB family redox-sensing transcriptional regulator
VSWQLRAACADDEVSPDLFFPPPGDDGAAAKRVCAGCSVREACLSWATETKVEHGVFGGLSWSERKALRAASRRRDRMEEEIDA